MDHDLLFAIGDIHGCYDKLASLLDKCRKLAWGGCRFVLLGDYVDRGPDSKGVIELLIRQQQISPDDFICLPGNHERLMLTASDPNRSDRDLMTWLGNGGEATLSSYGIGDPADIPEEHLAWIRKCPINYEDDLRFFVHAGLRPGIPFAEQSEQDLLWIREPFLSSEETFPKLIVHGHTPTAQRSPDVRPNRLNLDTGACFGGPLTSAAFSSKAAQPIYFVTDH